MSEHCFHRVGLRLPITKPDTPGDTALRHIPKAEWGRKGKQKGIWKRGNSDGYFWIYINVFPAVALAVESEACSSIVTLHLDCCLNSKPSELRMCSWSQINLVSPQKAMQDNKSYSPDCFPALRQLVTRVSLITRSLRSEAGIKGSSAACGI